MKINKLDAPLYIIKDAKGNQLSAPNPDDGELWDRVSAMEARGRRGLSVVVYTGKVQEGVSTMNNKLRTGKNMREGKRRSDPAKIEKAINSMYNSLCAGSANSEMMIQEARMLYGITYAEAMDAFRKAHDKFMSSNKLKESGSRGFYLTVYEESSVSGPEEGGYTSFGWEPISSKFFPTIEEARDALAKEIEGEEVLYDYDDRVHYRSSWDGSEYIVAIETKGNRGRTESPAMSWNEAEFGYVPRRSYFDKSGKRIYTNPYKDRKDKKAREELKYKFLQSIEDVHNTDELLDLYHDFYSDIQRVRGGENDVVDADVLEAVRNKLMELAGHTNESFNPDDRLDDVSYEMLPICMLFNRE